MYGAGDFHHKIRTFNVSGGTFTDVRGDFQNNYHVRGNFINLEAELGQGENLSIRVDKATLNIGCIRD
jgi:hypothetical protein